MNTRPFPRRAGAAVLLACAATLAQAQADGTSSLPTAEVAGQKNRDASTLTQPDLATARERIERTPGGAGVIDAASYRDGRVATLDDALGFAPGVVVAPRFGAEEARLSIRGSGAQRTFHGRGLKLMQDGVPLNLTDGSFDFQAVEALSARYVEIWRGANALQYGSDTLGGAINFVSPNGLNSDLVDARGEAGSFGYRRLHLATGDVHGRFDHYLAASAFVQDGFRRHAKQDSQRLFANLGYRIGDDVETRFYIGWVASNSELPGSLTKAQLQADPRQANAGNVSGDQKRDIDWLRLSNKTVWRFGGSARLELFVFASDKTLFHPIFQLFEQRNRDGGIEVRYLNESRLAGRGNRFVVGVSPGVGRTDEDRFVNVGGQRGARTNQSEQIARRLTVYAENQHDVLADLSAIVGVQHTRARRRLDDRFISGSGTDTASESFDLRYRGTSPKLGLLWRAAPDVQVFGNLSRSFEPPSFSELSGGVSPVLNRAQRATTFEVGTRGRSPAWQWDVAVYDGRYRDELLQVGTNVANAPITINADRTRHRGIEAGAADGGQGPLVWRAALTWQRLRLDGDPSFGDNPLPGLPKVFARAEVGWRFGNALTASVNAQHAGRYAIDFADSFHADAYTVLGLKLAQRVGANASWFVEGRNLADKRYAATTGIVRNAQGADAAQFLPGDRRALYAGVEWRL